MHASYYCRIVYQCGLCFTYYFYTSTVINCGRVACILDNLVCAMVNKCWKIKRLSCRENFLTHTRTHICTRTQTDTHIHTRICMYIYIRAHTHTCIQTHTSEWPAKLGVQSLELLQTIAYGTYPVIYGMEYIANKLIITSCTCPKKSFLLLILCRRLLCAHAISIFFWGWTSFYRYPYYSEVATSGFIIMSKTEIVILYYKREVERLLIANLKRSRKGNSKVYTQ